MMHKVKSSSLALSFFILTIGTLGGWSGSQHFFGSKIGSEFLKLALVFASIIYMSKVCIYCKAKTSLFYQLIFIGLLSIDLAWLLSCLILPLLLLESISKFEKAVMGAFYFIICFANVKLAVRTFEQKWKKIGNAAVEKNLKSGSDIIAWEEIVKSLKLTITIFIPGLPKNLYDIVTGLMFLLLALGYIFRSINPVLSMIALMIPCSTCAACCLQNTSYRFAEARKVRLIEHEKNVKFTAV